MPVGGDENNGDDDDDDECKPIKVVYTFPVNRKLKHFLSHHKRFDTFYNSNWMCVCVATGFVSKNSINLTSFHDKFSPFKVLQTFFDKLLTGLHLISTHSVFARCSLLLVPIFLSFLSYSLHFSYVFAGAKIRTKYIRTRSFLLPLSSSSSSLIVTSRP